MASKKPAVKSTVKRSSQRTSEQVIQTKSWRDVVRVADITISRIVHDRHSVSLSELTKRRIVAYGPWLAVGLWLVVIPQLLALTKTGGFLSANMLLEMMVFSRESWVMLVLLFITSIGVSNAVTDLAAQKIRGWNRIYIVTLVNASYILYRLFANVQQPAAAILSLLVLIGILFVLLDVRSYYRAD